jgi:cholesterol transport system auxiliary component
MNRRALLSLLALPALPACGALTALGDATTALDIYELRAPTDLPVASRALARDLIIEVPTAGGALDTDRILIRPNPLQAQYLPGVGWTDAAPVMIQTLILRSFEATGALRYVGRRPLGTGGDFALVSELTELQAEVGPAGAVTARIALTARLVRESNASVIATRRFAATGPVASTETMDVVSALDTAAGSVMRELVRWALGTMGAPLPQA